MSVLFHIFFRSSCVRLSWRASVSVSVSFSRIDEGPCIHTGSTECWGKVITLLDPNILILYVLIQFCSLLEITSHSFSLFLSCHCTVIPFGMKGDFLAGCGSTKISLSSKALGYMKSGREVP